MSPPLKQALTCYLKTQRKDKRKEILNVVYSLNKVTDPHVGKSAFREKGFLNKNLKLRVIWVLALKIKW